METRGASVADLDVLVADVQAGFDSYVDFAPDGWEPPSVPRDREWMVEILSHEDTWALMGLCDGRPVGRVAFYPARERAADDRRRWSERPKIPGLAHLWQLFVLPEWWGRGVAPVLLGAAVEEMGARGFAEARLHTPSAQARARRFYERRGWSPQAERWNEDLQLVLTEYRRPLP
jgi:GNAT superfamily N-acetyltransferase